MTGSVVLLHLAGAVALMLYATRLVRTGVERAYGEVLRLRLRQTMGRPAMAVLVGCGLAMAFQSSTAVTLLISSFAGSGIVGGLTGQLAVRGAEVGSALVAKLLTFDLSLVVPIALVAGTTLFMVTERREFRQIGRILIGIGLLLLSLEMIGTASEPLRDSPALPSVVELLRRRPGHGLRAGRGGDLALPFVDRRDPAPRHPRRPRDRAGRPRGDPRARRQPRQLDHRAAPHPGDGAGGTGRAGREPADARSRLARAAPRLSRLHAGARLSRQRCRKPGRQRPRRLQPRHPRPRPAPVAADLRGLAADRRADHPARAGGIARRGRGIGARRGVDRARRRRRSPTRRARWCGPARSST